MISEAEFAEDIADVRFDCLFTDEEGLADGGAGEPLCDQAQHFKLALADEPGAFAKMPSVFGGLRCG